MLLYVIMLEKICFCDRGKYGWYFAPITLELESDNVRDHCHLTGAYRRPAHSERRIIVKQSQSNLFSGILHSYSKHDCHLLFKTLVDKKKDKVKFKIIPKTNEE